MGSAKLSFIYPVG